MKYAFFLPCLMVLVLAVGACSTVGDIFKEADSKLPGERISILELEKQLEPDDPVLASAGFIAPSPWRNEFWPQQGGYPNHSMQNPALSGELKKIWSASIGKGASKRIPLTTQPVVAEGRIFTLDTDSRLKAFSAASGKQLWETRVRPEGEDDPVIAGGIAFSGGVLYVTGGYAEILAVSPDNGKIAWRAPMPAPARAAPTVIGERIFAATLDNRLLALDVVNGSVIWEHAALGESIGLVGAASPAANQDVVVPVFSSGEIFALRLENGSVAWSDNLATFRSFGGLTGLSDITGLPVLDGGMVFAVSFSGRMVAIDERSGSRIWQRDIGSSETPWVAGNMVFVTSSDNKLIALGKDSGGIGWVTDLNAGGVKSVMWTGPVLAGGRLIVASSEGTVAEFDPGTGKPIRQWKAGGGISVMPVVAGETLYLLTNSGTLAAYR